MTNYPVQNKAQTIREAEFAVRAAINELLITLDRYFDGLVRAGQLRADYEAVKKAKAHLRSVSA